MRWFAYFGEILSSRVHGVDNSRRMWGHLEIYELTVSWRPILTYGDCRRTEYVECFGFVAYLIAWDKSHFEYNNCLYPENLEVLFGT